MLDGVDLDEWPTAGVLKNISDFLEELIKVVSHRLTQRCKEDLPSYIAHIVMPSASACCPRYEQLWREQRPSRMAARVTLCDKICHLVNRHVRQAHH